MQCVPNVADRTKTSWISQAVFLQQFTQEYNKIQNLQISLKWTTRLFVGQGQCNIPTQNYVNITWVDLSLIVSIHPSKKNRAYRIILHKIVIHKSEIILYLYRRSRLSVK